MYRNPSVRPLAAAIALACAGLSLASGGATAAASASSPAPACSSPESQDHHFVVQDTWQYVIQEFGIYLDRARGELARKNAEAAAGDVRKIAAVSMLGCTSMGSGTGSVSPGDAPVTFAWTSKHGGSSGTMSATFDSGVALSGPFLQVTSATRPNSLQTLWIGWRSGWKDWGFWGPYRDTAFSTRYTGKVVANLKGPDAQQLRCRFHLNDPIAGLGGGGQGQCHFSGGRTVEAVFPRA